jgi:hypothetical protein
VVLTFYTVQTAVEKDMLLAPGAVRDLLILIFVIVVLL